MSFNRHLGLAAGADGAVVLDTRPEHEVLPGTIHFAVLTTLAEVSAAQAVGRAVVPASVQVNLLARARPGRLVGHGRVLRSGRRLAVAEGEVYQVPAGDGAAGQPGMEGGAAGELVAKAVVTFAVLDGR
ncbi:MAG TPA: PaaI family thioesterase [Thermoanaerobaculia bacterium]|nr:PaaI family thioesterase [Thermoanaerobaculia bacterium]